MPTPRSPLDKPSSHSRRPGISRRSSSDKSTKSSKHGIKAGQSSQGKTKDPMSDATSGAKAPSKSEAVDANGVGSHKVEESDVVGSSSLDTRKQAARGTENVDLYNATEENDEHAQVLRRGLVPSDNSPAEVERLRAAMNAQLQLTQQRDILARQLGKGNAKAGGPPPAQGRRARVSPINEETASPSIDEAFASPVPTNMETASTESARTIREGITPAGIPKTPSYPFPSMRQTRQLSWGSHRPFTALSPTVNPDNYAGGTFESGVRDQVLSGTATPASTLNFQPSGDSPGPADPNFESPNLYDLSLMLAAEPGLDAWWTSVVQVMRDLYKADRVTLSVPADSTDVENVPWGQKATFNAVEEDQLSLTYLPRGTSMVPSSGDTNDTSNSEETTAEDAPLSALSQGRPGMLRGHSFTAYEDTKRDPIVSSDTTRAALSRPSPIARAKSYLSARPDAIPRAATLQNAELNLHNLKDHLAFEDAKPSAGWEATEAAGREVRGRIFTVLQALDYEADPLIDSGGVLRVLERGKVIALTRDYPYAEDAKDEKSGGSNKSASSAKKDSPSEKSNKRKSPEVVSRISSFLGSSRRSSRSARGYVSDKGKSMPAPGGSRGQGDDDTRLYAPQYEEYEQAPPSPWAQSPAPSPAVRAETSENPFFADMPVDDETFNPRVTTQDYSQIPQVEAIGIDRSWTVLHIPLIHPLLSKPVQSFRLDAAAMEQRTAARKDGYDATNKQSGFAKEAESSKEKRTPIAILSILTPIIPYPSNLRHSLAHLAPHLATSFSLCRHYSNLETEIAGLSRKRPHTTGFGAVAPGGRPLENRITLGNLGYLPMDEHGLHRSMGGSITSPSDYSGVSRSTLGSPTNTPGWDPSSIGFMREKRSSGGSPSYHASEGYFNSRSRPGVGRIDTSSGSSITGARPPSKDSSPADSRSLNVAGSNENLEGSTEKSNKEVQMEVVVDEGDVRSSTTTPKAEPRPAPERPTRETNVEPSDNRENSPSRRHNEAISPRRQAIRTASSQSAVKVEKQHTQLHSYGADYGATFQSLPTTSQPTGKAVRTHSRSGSLSTPAELPQHMLPPSDRLKGLMLDSLPAHVFVALPATGEIVWVNNRYLNYRGQTVPELYQDPWVTIHPEERDDYLKAWSHAVRTGEQFSMQVRIRRFDGTYRWFYTRAVGHRDIRGVIVQWYGSHMDIHDQHIAEVKAARQEEIEASEAKHRQLANLIPQIIFAATEDEGVTFANEQWLSYTGQKFEESLGLGFMDFVHPEDLAKCHISPERSPTPQPKKKPAEPSRNPSQSSSSGGNSSNKSSDVSETATEATVKGALSRNNSSSTGSLHDYSTADLTELARSGVIKASTDSNGRLSYTTEVRLRSKHGEYRWHLVRCVEVDNISLGSGDGSWFGACTDINDHKLLETKLKEAMDSKTRFLSNMSHEIRTPLIGISGMVNFLQDTPLNDEQIDYANTIDASAKSLLNIINDILDLSKVDAGMMKLSYDWFHPRSLVEEVNEMVCTMAITKRLELNYIVDTDVPEMVKGDKFRIRQVLLNVVGNAIKFTTSGEVFSRCRIVPNAPNVGRDEVMLEFSVIDTGRGFTAEEADLIFKPFSQIDGSSTRQVGGSGLGLVISRNLVELHGGQMTGSAVPDEGSTFVFSAKFGLPTSDDYPEPPMTPQPSKQPSMSEAASNDAVARAMKQAGGNPMLANKYLQSPLVDSPLTESTTTSPAIVSSSGSEPSLRSVHSHVTTRSSGSSIAQSLAHFSEAARASGTDLSQMKLALPEKVTSPTGAVNPRLASASMSPTGSTPRRSLSVHGEELSRSSTGSSYDYKSFRPPMYSILIICPQNHSREATTQHIENTLPKDIPHQITAIATIAEAQKLIGGDDPVIFTHIVLNLSEAEEIVALVEQISTSISLPPTSIVVLSDPVQRQEVTRMAAAYDYDQLEKDNRVTFIFKPVKPSRLAVVFDPDKERDLSTDRNRFSAQQQVASQKQNYLDVSKRLGNKGYKVLLVEDNLVNQKVMLKYLSKIGISVDLALDGVECIEKLFAQPHSYYSLILCDLHMPRKDGYQTCREIRHWEKKDKLPRKPIIALSANVMADVLDKCVQAGFSNYVTKPVDFKALSTAMGDLLDPLSQPQSASATPLPKA